MARIRRIGAAHGEVDFVEWHTNSDTKVRVRFLSEVIHMKTFIKLLFITFVVGLIAAVVASIVSKKKLESMSDDEIREYLGVKLAGRVGDDQLVTIQDAVVSGVRGKRPSVDHYVEDVEDAMEDLDLVEEAAASEVMAEESAQEALEAVDTAIE